MSRSVVVLLVLAACTRPGASQGTPDSDSADMPDAPADAPVDLGPHPCNATDPRTVPLVVSPTPEAGEAPYVDVLATATTSIRVEIYEMGYGGILDALKAKAAAGVAVQVIFDTSKQDVNQKYSDQLAAAGAEVKWSSAGFTYQHAKFFVVDGRAAVLSTGNYSKTYSIDLERNFAVRDEDPADVADLVSLFDADWAGETPEMSCTRMVISPVNSRARVIGLIESAQSTLTIESMQFADTAVRAAVAARISAGVQVRAMLADAGWITANAAAAQFLKDRGVVVKYIPHLHTKVIVADGTSAYVGSENLSQTSLDHNREVGVIATGASELQPLIDTFETDWAAGTEF